MGEGVVNSSKVASTGTSGRGRGWPQVSMRSHKPCLPPESWGPVLGSTRPLLGLRSGEGWAHLQLQWEQA